MKGERGKGREREERDQQDLEDEANIENYNCDTSIMKEKEREREEEGEEGGSGRGLSTIPVTVRSSLFHRIRSCSICCSFFKTQDSLLSRFLRGLFLGQILSLLLTSTGIFSSALEQKNISIPTSQSALNYILLSFFYIQWRLDKRKTNTNTKKNKQPTINSPTKPILAENKATIDSRTATERYQYIKEIENTKNKSQRWREEGENVRQSSGLIRWDENSNHHQNNHYQTDIQLAKGSDPASPSGGELSSLTSQIKQTEDKANPRLRGKWWHYLIAAVVDVEANFVIVTAFRYTSVTSIMLLDCFTIPTIMLISKFYMGYGYNKLHYLGITIAIIGVGLTVLSDYLYTDDSGYPTQLFADRIWGDLLTLLSCILYAISNLMQENLVKKNGRAEFLMMLGIFGTVISVIQVSFLERQDLDKLSAAASCLVPFLGYSLCLFALYVLTPLLLQYTDATFYNLSLLTSDMYAVIYRWLFLHSLVNWMYWVALFTTFVGVICYHRKPPIYNSEEKKRLLSDCEGIQNSTMVDEVEKSDNENNDSNYQIENYLG